MTDYDPLTGANWDQMAATAAWSESMERVSRERTAPLRWQLRGGPGTWHWTFWNFGTWTGRVTVEPDGFHWVTYSFDTGRLIHEGVTTSLFEAFQSVEQNQVVKIATAHGEVLRTKTGKVITENDLDEWVAQAEAGSTGTSETEAGGAS